MSELLIKNLNWDRKYTLYLTITPDMQVSAESGFLDEKIEGVQAFELRPHGELIEREKLIEDSLKAEAFLPDNVIVKWFQQKISSAPTVMEASE